MDGDMEIRRGDVSDAEAVAAFCRGAEGATLVHAAAVIHPRFLTREFHRVNVLGSRNVLSSAKESGIRRVIVVSSNSPFGFNGANGDQFDENSPYHPYMGYGKSKVLVERMALEAAVQGHLEVVIVRPPWFYGPDQPPRQTLFFRLIRQGRFPVLGGGKNRRSMVYIDNLCQGILLAERVPAASGQAYWIADRRPYTMEEIVGTVERLLRCEFGLSVSSRRLRLPAKVSGLARLVDGALQTAGLYNQKIHVLSEMSGTIACSVARAERELGYLPQVELEEGMRRSIRWCLENNHAI